MGAGFEEPHVRFYVLLIFHGARFPRVAHTSAYIRSSSASSASSALSAPSAASASSEPATAMAFPWKVGNYLTIGDWNVSIAVQVGVSH